MDVVVLQVFVSLMLAVGSVLLFVHSAKQRDHDHSQRLALLPLESDAATPVKAEAEGQAVAPKRAVRGGKQESEPQRASSACTPGEQE